MRNAVKSTQVTLDRADGSSHTYTIYLYSSLDAMDRLVEIVEIVGEPLGVSVEDLLSGGLDIDEALEGIGGLGKGLALLAKTLRKEGVRDLLVRLLKTTWTEDDRAIDSVKRLGEVFPLAEDLPELFRLLVAVLKEQYGPLAAGLLPGLSRFWEKGEAWLRTTRPTSTGLSGVPSKQASAP